MKEKAVNQKQSDDLRKKAEEKLRRLTSKPLHELSAAESHRVIHELQVHQIELEMQNEELRHAQEELENSRTKYADLYDFAPIGYLTFDENGLIFEANLTAAEQLGIERSFLIKKPFSGFIHKDDQDIFYMHRQEVLKSSTRHTCELRIKRKDGSEFYAQIVSSTLLGHYNRIRTAVINITERRKAEEALKEKQHLNELLLNAIPHPAMLINTGRIVQAANQSALDIGVTLGEYCWKEFGKCEYLSDEDKKRSEDNPDDKGIKCIFCLADDAMKGPELRTMNDPEVHAFDRVWDTYWDPIDKDTFLHYAIDITDRKKAEDKLNSTLGELERSNTELERFAYIASHDLKEPLRTIRSFTDLLSQRYRGKLDKEADEFIGFVQDGTGRMEQLIDDLLTYSRVSESKIPVPVDCNKMLVRAIANLTVLIERKGGKVTFDPLPTLMMDDMNMELLFQNLINNGIKFHGEDPPRIHISARQTNEEWLFSISDNGIGIEEPHKEQIFQIFKRLHSRSEYAGTGIGLAICKKIIDILGGKIWVESEPGKGSVFFFTIPDVKK